MSYCNVSRVFRIIFDRSLVLRHFHSDIRVCSFFPSFSSFVVVHFIITVVVMHISTEKEASD